MYLFYHLPSSNYPLRTLQKTSSVPLVSPSLDGRGKGEGDIHPHPTLPHQGGGYFGCYFFRGIPLAFSTYLCLNPMYFRDRGPFLHLLGSKPLSGGLRGPFFFVGETN